MISNRIFAILILLNVSLALPFRTPGQTSLRDSCLLDQRYNLPVGNLSQGRVTDRWGRDVSNRLIRLVDWEGPMGNPEMKYQLMPPASARYPVTAAIRIDRAPRLYFTHHGGRLASNQDENGPSFEHTFNGSGEVYDMYIGNNPDPNLLHEEYSLRVEFTDALGAPFVLTTPIHVCDEDRERGLDFRFILDVSKDKTGFYNDNPQAVALMQRIADDVAYYLDDQQADSVAAHAAITTVNFDPVEKATNPIPYKGFYLFSTGWRHGTNPNDIWSTGAPGETFMTRNGAPLPIYAIGTVRPHPDGDRSAINTKGWNFETADTLWWKIGGLVYGPSPTGDCPPGQTECQYRYMSFYGVMKHELLHALAYEQRYPRWKHFIDVGCIDDPGVMALTGQCTPLADLSHAWDPVLHKRQPRDGIELIDDFELAVMKAVGWRMRETTPFVELRITSEALTAGAVGRAYDEQIRIEGGILPFRFSTLQGRLPFGLRLNSHTGRITGTPREGGEFQFDVLVEDYGVDNAITPNGVTKSIRLTISGTGTITDPEERALAAFYASTNGYEWTEDSNWFSDTLSNWYGITVQNGRVSKIEMERNNLSGSLPPELGNLMGLKELRLSTNRLSGAVPGEIGNLKSLEFVNLSINQLTDTLPRSFGSLPKLWSLAFWNNRLTGPIPEELGSLSNLTLLQLGKNSLSGPVPATLGNLSKLRYLFVADNQLSGPLPSQLGNLVELLHLELQNNQLQGALPSSLQNLKMLNRFLFDRTQLCEPADSTFQAWLLGIATVSSTGLRCPVTSVETINATPREFALEPNYPNPFNPSTTIRFSLPQKEFVTLKVYTLLGQEIATIVNQQLNSGSYDVIWDARDFPSGVYFYRFEAGSFTESGKLVLLR